MKIALVLPSRARPNQFLRMVRSALTTRESCEVEVYLGLDMDDDTVPQYMNHINQLDCKVYTTLYPTDTPRRLMWNELSLFACKNGADFVWQGSDDIVFERPQKQVGYNPDGTMKIETVPPWDAQLEYAAQEIRPHIPDGRYLLWGWDGSCGAGHATHPFVRHEWIERLGKVMPECCQAFDGDTFMTDLVRATGRGAYLPELITKHYNPKYGLAEYDKVWHDARPVQKEDYAVYRGPAGRAELKEAIERLGTCKQG